MQAKNEAANAKLRQMVKDQQEAEKKKVQSQEIQQQLRMQTVAINEKRDDVMADLAQVEPAVIDAQNGMYLSENSLLYYNIDFSMYIFKSTEPIVKFYETNFLFAFIIILNIIFHVLHIIRVIYLNKVYI